MDSLFHATYKPRLKSILSKGLIVDFKKKNWEDSEDLIYLADDPYVAESYAESSDMVNEDWLDQIVILEIDINYLEEAFLEIDSNNLEGDTYQYSKNIPPEAIRIFR